MNGHQYEYHCAKLLKRKGFSGITVTKGSGDQGIDVIAYSGGKKYGIQCKYYTSPVGNHAVQEAFSGAKYYNCDIAVVMTNTTFTPASRELAKKTGVLLWENSRIPFGMNSFWLTKFIGILVCIIGILGFITLRNIDGIKFPILQAVELIFWVLGGVFAIFEYRNWGAAFLSCTFYLGAAIMNLIFRIATMKLPSYDFLIFIGISVMSFLRMDYLHKVTNGYHVWEKGFRRFVNDNFSKSRKIKLQPEKYMSREEFDKELEEIGKGIDEVHNDIEKIGMELEEQRDIFEIDKKLKRTKELANIANRTANREIFYNSINEIKDILRELSRYEGKLPFVGSPTADLKNLEQIEQIQIELLEKRIAEKAKEEIKIEEHNKSTVKNVVGKVKSKPVIRKLKNSGMNQYDIEQFAKECNAHIIREERKEREELEWRKIEERNEKD